MITVEVRNKDAELIAEALRRYRNSNTQHARWLTGSKQKGMQKRRKKFKHNAERADILRGLFL